MWNIHALHSDCAKISPARGAKHEIHFFPYIIIDMTCWLFCAFFFATVCVCWLLHHMNETLRLFAPRGQWHTYLLRAMQCLLQVCPHQCLRNICKDRAAAYHTNPLPRVTSAGGSDQAPPSSLEFWCCCQDCWVLNIGGGIPATSLGKDLRKEIRSVF